MMIGKKTKSYWIFILLLLLTPAIYGLKIIKGPYLQNVQRKCITIMWETDIKSDSHICYQIAKAESNWIHSRIAMPVKVHKIVLQNLLAGTTYRYWVQSRYVSVKTSSKHYFFKTAPSGEQSFTFYLWGDNQYGIDRFRQIIRYMEHPKRISSTFANVRINKADIAICVGDICNNGKSLLRWQQDLFEPLGNFMHTVPVYDAVGNHELYDVDKEDFANMLSERKSVLFGEFMELLPSEKSNYQNEHQRSYYDLFLDIPAPRKGVRFFHFTYSNSIFIFLDSNFRYIRKKGEQYQWLLHTLESAQYKQAKYKFVIFHIPAINRVWDKKIPRNKLVHFSMYENVVPLLVKYDVDVVFSGHAHSYQKGQLVGKNGHITYFIISGGGGGALDTVIHDDFEDVIPDQNIDIVHFHYLTVDITTKEAKITRVPFSEIDHKLSPIAPEVIVRIKPE